MRRAALLVVLLACAGCDEMVRQPRAPVYGTSGLFANGAAMQTPPAGAISREDGTFRAALDQQPPLTLALIERGRERYDIYCKPCHGLAGDGRGVIPSRGFPQPPDFHQPALRNVSSRFFVDVITNGYGVMYAYGDRVPPADRWAIAAYIRALQLSQNVPANQLAPDERARLELADGR